MNKPKVYVDFHNADAQGRLRLNCVGTTRDLAARNIRLRSGLEVFVYSDDADDQGRPREMHATGTVRFSKDEKCWVAEIDWSQITSHLAPPRKKSLSRVSGDGSSKGVLAIGPSQVGGFTGKRVRKDSRIMATIKEKKKPTRRKQPVKK